MTRLLDDGENSDNLADIAADCTKLANELGIEAVKGLFDCDGRKSKKLIMASRLLKQVGEVLREAYHG